MASAKKKRSKKTPQKSKFGTTPKSGSESDSDQKSGSSEKPPLFHREVRPYIYAGLCFALGLVYFVLFTWVLPNRHVWVSMLLYSFVVAVFAMGGAMLIRGRKSWFVAVAAGGYMLLAWVVTLVLILMTASFLAGVYGAFGKAASMFALMTAVLSFQLVALLPMLQVKFLMTRAGRRWFNLEPLWP